MSQKKAKKDRRVKGNSLIGSVDMSKETHYGYMRTLYGEDVKTFPVKNNREGFEEFHGKLVRFQEQHGCDRIIVGYESSGPYGEPLMHYLRGKGVEVVQVNPMHTKRIKELEGNSPNKTDRKDPRVIADVMCLGHALSVVVPTGAAAELRRLTQARDRAVEHQTRMKNQVGAIEFLMFPELERVIPDLNSKSARYVLKHCPLPEQVVTLGEEMLAEQLHRVSRGRVGKKRAGYLYRAARESIGIREGVEGMCMEIAFLVEGLERQETYIGELERRMTDLLREIPYSESILSVRGIGTVTAAALIGEVGDFRAFSSSEELLKLAGLNLYEVSSGNHKGEKHITKRGRSLLRKFLYYGTLNASRPGGVLYDAYQELLAKGKPPTKALVILMRKLVRILFALVRDGSVYREKKEQQAA